jgi:DNA-binding IclR family transcriptional regulator
LVNGLVATGFLDRNGSRYFLGPAPYVLTLQARQNLARLVLHSDLTNLAEDGGHTVLFAVRIGDDVVTIDEAGNQPVLQYLARTRQRVPLLASSVGRVILAALPDDDMHDYLRRSSHQDLVREFVNELTEIRRTGVSVSVWPDPPPGGDPEGSTGVVATVVRDHTGRVVGAACIGHDFEHFKEHLGQMTQTLLRHVRHWETRQDDTGPMPSSLDAVGTRVSG